MKTRDGFVSNSSSSSFLIFGISVGKESEEAKKYAELCDCKNESKPLGLVCTREYAGSSDVIIGFAVLGDEGSLSRVSIKEIEVLKNKAIKFFTDSSQDVAVYFGEVERY